MSRKLPPFAAIRAFEATARLGSLRLAAEELCVTISAVSHQIRNLEDYSGRNLFDRRSSGLTLTEDGKRYLDQVSGALRTLETGTDELMRGPARGPLRVRSTPGFANRWLVPRLSRFMDTWPEIDIELSTDMPPADFRSAECDVLIHWGSQALPGADVTPFFSTRRFCAASRDLFRTTPRPTCISEFAGFTLLHDIYNDGWDEYVSALGGVDFDYSAGPRFAHCDLSIAAIEAGHGIGIVYSLIAEDSLRAGKIVKVLPLEIGPYLIHSLATASDSRPNARVTAFTDWVLDEAGRQERAVEAMPELVVQ